MENPSEFLSPGEIKKYIYCPYGWYYERYYGRKKIYELYKKRNKKFGYADTNRSFYNKGQKFHGRYRPFSLKRALVQAATVLLLLFIYAFLISKGIIF